MSVVGFDFGNTSCVIAVAQKGGIDVIMNEVSSRQTATMAAFGDKERYLGEPAATQYLRNIKNTVTNVKLLMGRKFSEPDVQQEIKSLPFKVVPLADDEIGIEVMYAGERKVFSPITITSMIFQKLKEITEKATQKPAADVVVSVPGWWTDKQRRAMLDASKIAGLNSLRLLNETTAAALGYGFFKTNQFDEKEPTRVMFFDMGNTTTSVSVVEFLKGKLRVLSSAFDRNLGGRNFDGALVDHFLKEFKDKYKLDVRSNQKALIRVEMACERLKKMLNTNPEAQISIDSLMNDVDVRGVLKRADLEGLVQHLLERAMNTVKQALETAGVTADKLNAIEIIGGATRLAVLQNKLGDFLKKEISKTLNFEEAVAKGCALQCAMLSPVFKVKEFAVQDVNLYPIKLSWKPLDAVNEGHKEIGEVFAKYCSSPSGKMVSLYKNSPVELLAEYSDASSLPSGTDKFIGKFRFDVPPVNGEAPKLRIKVRLDLHNIFSVESVEMVETLEEVPSTPPQTETTESKEGGPSPMQDAVPTTPPPASPQLSEGEQKEEEKKKKKVKRTTLDVQEKTTSLPVKDLQLLTEEEGRMLAADRLAVETAEKKNAVESYVYDMRNKLNDSLNEFASESEKNALSKLFEETEQWLYGEGEDATKSVYVKKLDELKALGDPIVKRKYEHENRYEALVAIKSSIENFRSTATSVDPKYDHITKEEREKVLADLSAAEKWITEQMMKQDKLPKSVNPSITTAEIQKKTQEISRNATAILNKPKPAPPKEEKKEEKKPEEPKADNTQQPQKEEKPQNTNSQSGNTTNNQGTPSKPEAEMDLD